MLQVKGNCIWSVIPVSFFTKKKILYWFGTITVTRQMFSLKHME